MNLTSTSTQPHAGIAQPGGHRQGLRGVGAGDALGFAQMLRAFEPEPESLVTRESHSPHERADEKADQGTPGLGEEPPATQTGDAGGVRCASGTGDASKRRKSEPEEDGATATDREKAAVPGIEGAAGGDPSTRAAGNPSTDPQPASETGDQPDDVAGDERPGQQREAALRLLHDRGEQAKLSIKGLVRSLTRSGGTDATTVAVETRLGTDDAGPTAPVEPRPADEQPSKQQQPPQPAGNTVIDRSPSTTADVTPPVHGRGATTGRVPLAGAAMAVPVDADPDQAGAGAQQARGIRADAGAVSQTARAAPVLDPTRLAPLDTAARAAQAIRGGSAQSVRAVTAGESARLGASLTDASTTPGSLAWKTGAAPDAKGADRAAVLAQLQRGLASLLRSGKGDMTLRLTPASLGEVRIRIKSQGGRLSVRLEASTDRAGELLSDGAKDLSAHLRAKGVHVEHLSVDRRDAAHDAPQPDPGNAHGQGGGHAGHDPRPGAREHAGSRRQPAAPIDEPDYSGDTGATSPGAVWTELGLDAIA